MLTHTGIRIRTGLHTGLQTGLHTGLHITYYLQPYVVDTGRKKHWANADLHFDVVSLLVVVSQNATEVLCYVVSKYISLETPPPSCKVRKSVAGVGGCPF